MTAHFGSYPHHSDSIECPKCGRMGKVVWEEVCHAESHQKELVRIEGGFYERLRNKSPYPIELVCGICGTAQKAALQA